MKPRGRCRKKYFTPPPAWYTVPGFVAWSASARRRAAAGSRRRRRQTAAPRPPANDSAVEVPHRRRLDEVGVEVLRQRDIRHVLDVGGDARFQRGARPDESAFNRQRARDVERHAPVEPDARCRCSTTARNSVDSGAADWFAIRLGRRRAEVHRPNGDAAGRQLERPRPRRRRLLGQRHDRRPSTSEQPEHQPRHALIWRRPRRQCAPIRRLRAP